LNKFISSQEKNAGSDRVYLPEELSIIMAVNVFPVRLIFNNNYPCKILKVGNIMDFTRRYKCNVYN